MKLLANLHPAASRCRRLMDAASLLPLLIRAAASGPWAVIDAVSGPLEKLGFTQRRMEGPHGAAIFGRGEPRIVFSGHVDVVPVGVGWTRNAFGGETDEGRIWGRGACDMLGSVACFVDAVAAAPDAPCAILLTPDEETAMIGATRALEAGWLEGVDAIVVGEPTDHAVGVAEKGVLWLRVLTEGRNAHGSMPDLGINAAERLLKVLPGMLSQPPTGEHALLGRATCNLGQMHSGEAVNQVPAAAHADLDIRYLPGETDAAIVARFERTIQDGDVPATLEILSSHVPFERDPEGPFARACLDALRYAGHPEPRALGLPYGTEASKFAPAGFDVVILGPGEAGLAHTNRESIRLEDLEMGARTYEHLLRNCAEKL